MRWLFLLTALAFAGCAGTSSAKRVSLSCGGEVVFETDFAPGEELNLMAPSKCAEPHLEVK